MGDVIASQLALGIAPEFWATAPNGVEVAYSAPVQATTAAADESPVRMLAMCGA
jgi:hypothetical protein